MRLVGYDYSQPGSYFVTLCAQGRSCRFGEIIEGSMILNDAGWMVDQAWKALVDIPGVEPDEHIVMPNHVHGILVLADTEGGNQSLQRNIPALIGRFKSVTTVRYTEGVRIKGWPGFDGRLWQRGYHDRIIRTDIHMARVREYIRNNPMQWELDSENPNRPHRE